jgi:hypothetical protein
MMLLNVFIISLLPALDSADCSKYDHSANGHRITVTGTAIVIKNDAAVRTADGNIYYLDGVFEWEEKYEGRRVRITGKLVIKKYGLKRRDTDDPISVLPQRRLGTWKIIKKPKWSLVE